MTDDRERRVRVGRRAGDPGHDEQQDERRHGGEQPVEDVLPDAGADDVGGVAARHPAVSRRLAVAGLLAVLAAGRTAAARSRAAGRTAAGRTRAAGRSRRRAARTAGRTAAARSRAAGRTAAGRSRAAGRTAAGRTAADPRTRAERRSRAERRTRAGRRTPAAARTAAGRSRADPADHPAAPGPATPERPRRGRRSRTAGCIPPESPRNLTASGTRRGCSRSVLPKSSSRAFRTPMAADRDVRSTFIPCSDGLPGPSHRSRTGPLRPWGGSMPASGHPGQCWWGRQGRRVTRTGRRVRSRYAPGLGSPHCPLRLARPEHDTRGRSRVGCRSGHDIATSREEVTMDHPTPTARTGPVDRARRRARPAAGARPGHAADARGPVGGTVLAGLAWIVREVTHVPGVLRLRHGRLSFESTRGVLFDATRLRPRPRARPLAPRRHARHRRVRAPPRLRRAALRAVSTRATTSSSGPSSGTTTTHR